MSYFDDQLPANPGDRIHYVFWAAEGGGLHYWLAATEEDARRCVEGEQGIEPRRFNSFPTAASEIAETLLTEACGYEDEEGDLLPDWAYALEIEEGEMSDEQIEEFERKQAEYYSEERLEKIRTQLDKL
ncbi:MAG: hypothetical protein QF918_08480 [Pirellulaceae bacterium]|nr:hypothetical protein [Pirellulaceae bacterium]MDP6553636.1 hypothetical protein [Pirellulaceae bacterium]